MVERIPCQSSNTDQIELSRAYQVLAVDKSPYNFPRGQEQTIIHNPNFFSDLVSFVVCSPQNLLEKKK